MGAAQLDRSAGTHERPCELQAGRHLDDDRGANRCEVLEHIRERRAVASGWVAGARRLDLDGDHSSRGEPTTGLAAVELRHVGPDGFEHSRRCATPGEVGGDPAADGAEQHLVDRACIRVLLGPPTPAPTTGRSLGLARVGEELVHAGSRRVERQVALLRNRVHHYTVQRNGPTRQP